MDLRIGQRWALQSKNECAMREGQKRKHSMRQELDGAHFSKTLITETRQSRSTTSTYKELDNLEQQLNMGIHNIGTMLGCQYFASIANRCISCICNITISLEGITTHYLSGHTHNPLKIAHTRIPSYHVLPWSFGIAKPKFNTHSI